MMTVKPLGVRVRKGATTFSFLAPALLGIAVFFLYPLGSAVYFSFTKFDLLSVPEWVGLDNYRRMADDPFLLQSIRNTLWMVVVFVPVRIIGAIGLSMLLTQLKRGAGFFRTVFYLPALVPPVAATIAFVYLLKPGTGPVNHFLEMIGIEGPLWFNSPAWAKPSLVLLGLWAIGDLMVIFLAAVLGVPASLYEAATIAFVYLLKPGTGPVNHFLESIGIQGPLWFNSPTWAKPSLVLLGLWAIGDLMVIFLAAVLGVPASLYEAAELDGANAWQRFRSITLPTIQPVVLFAAVTGVIYTLQYFDQAAVAGSIASGQATVGGGISSNFGFPEGSTFTYPLWLYTVGFRYSALGYANALAIGLFVVALGVTLILLRRAKAFTGEES